MHNKKRADEHRRKRGAYAQRQTWGVHLHLEWSGNGERGRGEGSAYYMVLRRGCFSCTRAERPVQISSVIWGIISISSGLLGCCTYAVGERRFAILSLSITRCSVRSPR